MEVGLSTQLRAERREEVQMALERRRCAEAVAHLQHPLLEGLPNVPMHAVRDPNRPEQGPSCGMSGQKRT